MSTLQTNFVINPTTQRPVKIGSRTWRKLINEGLIKNTYTDPNELYVVDKTTQDIQPKIEELNKDLPDNLQAVRGRGKYKNKIVKRQKQPSTDCVTKHTVKRAANIVSNNIEDINEYDDLENELEKLIMAELISTKRSNNVKKTLKKQKEAIHESYQDLMDDYESEEDDYESE